MYRQSILFIVEKINIRCSLDISNSNKDGLAIDLKKN